MGFNLGNAFKYIWRCDLKNNAIEDLEKAVQYLDFQAEMIVGSRLRHTTYEAQITHKSGISIEYISSFFSKPLAVAVECILSCDMQPTNVTGLVNAQIYINQEIADRKANF